MPPRLLVFGAFDRHNLGDLLFARLGCARWQAWAPRPCGLADRDLSPWGGPRVDALHRLAAEGALDGATLVHAGGEILDCSASQAATMLLPPDQVDATLSWLAREPAQREAWRRRMLGTAATLPYVAGRDAWPMLGALDFAPVGGVAIDALPAADRAVLAARLRQAGEVQVRDGVTHAHLAALGMHAHLAPDPVETVAMAVSTPPAAAPRAVLAVQLSAEFDDDATLDRVADALAPVALGEGLEAVVFRAGAAPWHDDPRTPRRLADRLGARGARARLFGSLHVDALVDLLARASACACSSLHGLVVAAAHGVPVVGLRQPGDAPTRGKLGAYVGTWHAPEDGVRAAGVDDLGAALRDVLATDPARRHAAAHRRARRADEALSRISRRLPAPRSGG